MESRIWIKKEGRYAKTLAKIQVHEYFSNSLLIHDVKTKKIRGTKKVWIPGLN